MGVSNPRWKRKVRYTARGEKFIQIPPEIPIDAEYLYVTVEDGKIILSPPDIEEKAEN